jgi:protoporphyrin/coproporphyrin ferrochelatase
MYDALLVLSFGGPEGPDDVMPFLENVTRGRGIPSERLAGVAEHYRHFGGVSPINGQNRALIAAVRAELDAHGVDLPIYWGNRNWHPLVTDTVRAMAADGVRRALVFVTSAYSSYSSCRQYQDDLVAARASVGDSAPTFDKIRHFFDHPGFIDPQVDAVRAAVARIDPPRRASTRLVFTAHSIPVSMASTAGPDGGLYVEQLRAAAQLIASSAASDLSWDLVFQSRSGPPSVPWLEPDVRDQLRMLARDGATDVVVVPVGFVSDHLEVQWDLDVEAAAVAAELGLGFTRTPAPGTDPRFVAMVRELVQERLDPTCPKLALSSLGPSHDACPAGCCPAPIRSVRPAAASA